MIIYINDDKAYLAWLAAHRRGFVVNCHHPPTPRYLMLHRANCADLSVDKKRGWTMERYIKVCASSVRELENWARSDVRGRLRACPRCRPPLSTDCATRARRRSTAPPSVRLTRLGNHLLSFVLEVAVMSLDGMTHYQADPPTIRSLARYVGKTLHQIEPALRRLIEDGYIAIDGDTRIDVKLKPHQIIYPTNMSLRTIPAFATMSVQELDLAIASLASN